MPCQSAKLSPLAQHNIQYGLSGRGVPHAKNDVISSLATRLATPEEYLVLVKQQGDPQLYNWTYFGNGLAPTSTVSRWRCGHPVRVEAHYALSLAAIYILGWNTTVEQLTEAPLEPIVRYRENSPAIQAMLENFRCLAYYPREARL